MNKTNNLSTEAVPSEGVLTDMTSLERRRLLFKAIGKGATVGAVLSSPMLAMASGDHDGDGETILVCKHPTSTQLIMCSVSGMQSAIGSRQLNTAPAGGRSPGKWGKLEEDDFCVRIEGSGDSTVWGPDMKRDFPSSLSNWSWNTPVRTVLTRSDNDLSTSLTLGMLMAAGNGKCKIPGSYHDHKWSYGDYGQYADMTEVHWICAILNAAVVYPRHFPYSALEIRRVANSTDNDTYRADLYKLLSSLEGKYEF